MFKQIVHSWMFGPMDLGRILEDLAAAGADGIDLSASFDESHNNLSVLSGARAGSLLAGSGLPVEVITPLYRSKHLDFSHPDESIRKTTIEFTNGCVDLARLYGAKRVLVSASRIGPAHQIHSSYEEDWKRATDSLSRSAGYAEKQGVKLMLEPINRYMVGLVHTVAEARRMINEIGSPAICIVPDAFHMNIEEENGVLGGIFSAKGDIGCLHLGNNNRRPPSAGAIDWIAILRALKETGFDGPLSHEPVELYFSENKMASDYKYREKFISGLAESIVYLRRCMKQL